MSAPSIELSFSSYVQDPSGEGSSLSEETFLPEVEAISTFAFTKLTKDFSFPSLIFKEKNSSSFFSSGKMKTLFEAGEKFSRLIWRSTYTSFIACGMVKQLGVLLRPFLSQENLKQNRYLSPLHRDSKGSQGLPSPLQFFKTHAETASRPLLSQLQKQLPKSKSDANISSRSADTSKKATFSTASPTARFQEKQSILTKEPRERRDERESNKDDSFSDQDDHAYRVQKSEKKNLQGKPSAFFTYSGEQEEDSSSRKPILERPKFGIFALCHMLDKMGMASESASYAADKKEIEANEVETTATHKKLLEDMKKAVEKEKQVTRWGLSLKIFAWIGSIMGIIAGVAMIATGVGAVAGSLLVVGGIISAGTQLMEITGGWNKVADLLPGDDPDRKRAVISWIQIGIGIFSLILAGSGLIVGGLTVFKEAFSIGNALFGCIVTAGQGICSIGRGVEDYLYRNKIADSKMHEKHSAMLKFVRDDLMEKMEDFPDRLLNYYESLARALGFMEEINRSYQRAWTR